MNILKSVLVAFSLFSALPVPQVKWDEDTDTFSGNRCKRGARFAMQERTAPMRTVTTTVRTDEGKLLPVRTAAKISKAHVLELVSQLRTLEVGKDHAIGDQVYQTRLEGEDVRVLATASD